MWRVALAVGRHQDSPAAGQGVEKKAFDASVCEIALLDQLGAKTAVLVAGN
jgi:hypothetical protein